MLRCTQSAHAVHDTHPSARRHSAGPQSAQHGSSIAQGGTQGLQLQKLQMFETVSGALLGTGACCSPVRRLVHAAWRACRAA